MRSRMYLSRTTRVYLLGACVGLTVLATASQNALAELRIFAVTLAHSPKSQLDTNGVPGLPPDGLHSVEDIRKRYFDQTDPNLDSFAEYWREISYGDVIITGDVFEWVSVPWAFEPNAPNGGERASAADFIDLHANLMDDSLGVNPPVPAPFAYGAGEDFCDNFPSGDITPSISASDCGALIITDFRGGVGANPNPPRPAPQRGPGLDDVNASGVAVWTPGERFIDLDGDNRWDGKDEVNDRICRSPNGCQVPLCSVSRTACNGDGDCPGQGTPNAQTCVPRDPLGSGMRGCNTRGCGTEAMPWIDWDQSGEADAINNCAVPEWNAGNVSLTTGLLTSNNQGDDCNECPVIEELNEESRASACAAGFCHPTNCRVPDASGNLPDVPPCCSVDPDNEDCVNGVPRLTCDDGDDPFPQCCEFSGVGQIAFMEPFEDFMIRWNPNGVSPDSVWVRVTEDYIRANYPGDVEALVARTGNGVYDSPDVFLDRGNTKMMQDASTNRFGWITPRPGTYRPFSPVFEQPWFPDFWTQRYGSTPPPWPGTTLGSVGSPNSPVMRPFDPENPLPPIVRNEDVPDAGRWFRANTGGRSGTGEGTIDDPVALFNSDNFDDGRILPDEEFGYYDGWVEHDDLASSRYHLSGDKRLGEITSPTTDTTRYPNGSGEVYTAISGVDLGTHTPFGLGTPDTITVAAGPRALNIHGEKGFDAGDVCILEWLTWRTDGTSPTVSADWESENGPYHPFAGPSSPRNDGPKGFADYNLDGMIDQGEVRPELSESYSVDSHVTTIDDGTHTDYPFNRRRLMEDIVEALDFNVDWDDFVDADRANTVSGIVLVPGNSYTDVNRFPLSPGFFPIHTEDTGALRPGFHDLVICQDCRDFPAAVAYAAHEYLHAWEFYPDLYDYDVFDNAGAINCPVGLWDIMERNARGLVHPSPPLKDELSGWMDAVDLRTVLTPGAVSTITLPQYETVRDASVFFLDNPERPAEREYFWSAGSAMDDGGRRPGERFPGKGMLIMHTQDFLALNNPEALASQQRTTPANFRIVQADGSGDLEACSSTDVDTGGNTGDIGDLWGAPGSATRYNFSTTPPAIWSSQNSWTGMDIMDVRPDGQGSVSLTLSLTPTNIPSLRFIEPPGGETVGTVFQVRFEATDVFGGTTIELYYTTDPLNLSTSAANRIGSQTKGAPGTVPSSMNWNIGSLPDGRYWLFAKLIPGPGLDGSEQSRTSPRASRNNKGNGTLTVDAVDISSNLSARARSETWVATCINPAGTEWVVYSSLTQREPEDPIPGPFPHAFTCPSSGACATPYTSIGGEVRFTIRAGSVPFTEGDSFNFTTTGLTAPSAAVEIIEGKISRGPRAVIVAAPLTVRPGETVSFDGSQSTDPQSQSLTYLWTFGDGSAAATGETASHVYRDAGTFVATLRVTNQDDRIGEASVEVVVFNNRPNAVFTASETSGSAPLTVNFSGSGSSDTETDAANLIFQWDFGDGSTANDQAQAGTIFQSVAHTYRNDASGRACTATVPCPITVRLEVTDEGGKSHAATLAILVGNSDPIAVVTAVPDEGDAPLTVTFDATESSDADGQALTITWDFDDGSATATGSTVTHVYTHTSSTSQQFRPTATVSDGFGGTATWTGTISVAPIPEPNDPPVAAFTISPAEAVGVLGDTFSFDASATTDAQQNKDSLIYKWAFGDGSFGTGITVSHTYSTIGTFQVELTVTDSRSATNIVTKTVTINPPVNRPPTAIIATGPRTGTAPALLTFDGRNSFDLDGGQTLTFSWAFREAGVLLETLTGSLVSRTFPDPGSFSVVLTVNDGNGGTDTSDPIVVTIAEAPEGTAVGGGEPEPGQGIPDSAGQRPTGGGFCGLGMVSGMFGSFFGLSLMVATRGRRRPR